VKALVETGVKLKLTSLFKTVQELVHADVFVLGRSTFSLGLMLLSKHAGIGQFYMFAYNWSDVGSHWNCVETQKYYQAIMVSWLISPDQIALLKTETCEKWLRVIRIAQFYYYHGKDGTPFYF
jgi:hypothetical protein